MKNFITNDISFTMNCWQLMAQHLLWLVNAKKKNQIKIAKKLFTN